MNETTLSVLCGIIVTAAATAGLIHRWMPSYEAFVLRRVFAVLAVKRAFITCRHAFDAEARRVDRYSRIMVDLETALELRNGIDRRISELAGSEGRATVQDLPEYRIIERYYDRVRTRAIAYLSAMDEEDIAVVARSFQRGILEGAVEQDAVEAFFRDE